MVTTNSQESAKKSIKRKAAYWWAWIKARLFWIASSLKKTTKRPWINPEHWIAYRWTRAVKAAGLWEVKYVDARNAKIGRIHTHQLRALRITDLLEAGYTPRQVQAFTQHECIDTIMRYYWRIQEEEARRAIMQENIKHVEEEVVTI